MADKKKKLKKNKDKLFNKIKISSDKKLMRFLYENKVIFSKFGSQN